MTSKTVDVEHLQQCIEMIKLNQPDQLMMPITPESSRPSSVAESSIFDSAIAFESRFDSDDDVNSSVFSELDDEEQVYQKPLKGFGSDFF